MMIIEEDYPLKCLKLGNSFSNHFEIMIIPKEGKGKIMFKDRNELTIYKFEFGEDAIEEIKKFLKMLEGAG